MGTLILAFLFMMLVIFGSLMFSMKSSSEEKALEKRITHIKAAPGSVSSESAILLRSNQDAGGFAWLESLATTIRISERLQSLIIQSDTNVSIGKLMIFSGMSALVVFAALYIFTLPLIAALGAFVALFFPILFLRIKRNRRVDKFNAGLADSIDMMSRSLRAGHSVVASIGIVAEQAVEPVKFEFNEVFKKQNYGLPLREALMQLLERVPSQDLRVLITGMLVQKETGGNLAEILDRITFVIRERIRIKGEIRTHTAQGRLTGYILCALPIVMLILIDFINPGYSDVLFKEGTGRKLLFLGVGLLIAGGLSIRKIINGIEV